MNNKHLTSLLLGLILLLAAGLRLTGLAWDNYQHFHPDERYISWVATTIERPNSLATALDPQASSFNPFYWPPDAASPGIEVLQDERRDFAYGHLPLYLGVAATRLAEWVGPAAISLLPHSWTATQDIFNAAERIEFHHLTAVGRALTALIDVGTIWLLFWLGRALFNETVGLLAAAFLALNVMHIQLAHFFTADPYLTFFVVAALACLVGVVQSRRIWPLALAAVCIGLAIGSKFAAALLLLPLAVTVWFRWSGWGRRAVWLGTAVGLIFLTFALTNPFALLDMGCSVITPAAQIGPVEVPALNWKSCYLENIVKQGRMVRGDRDVGFVRQYAGTRPFLYFLEMQWKWGMGPLLGSAAFLSLFWFLWQTWSQIHSKNSAFRIPHSAFIIFAWLLPFLLTTGGFSVKFMRYLQPATPFLMLLAAAMIGQWRSRQRRMIMSGIILLGTGLYALAFVNMYQQPHPWITASRWVYDNVEPGALIAGEQWDDSLPATMWSDGRLRQRGEYEHVELTWLTFADERDTPERLQANLARLAAADYVVIVSNRVYGVAPRQPERFPLSSQYHQLLFDGVLGYELVGVYGRFPRLGGVVIQPDRFGWPGLEPPDGVADYLDSFPAIHGGRVDESFVVYDQPLTMIFRNAGEKTADQMRPEFDLTAR